MFGISQLLGSDLYMCMWALGGRVRQTILHVDVSAGAIVSSPRMSMAQQAAEDDENNTTDEEREDEELSRELAEEYNAAGQGGEGGDEE